MPQSSGATFSPSPNRASTFRVFVSLALIHSVGVGALLASTIGASFGVFLNTLSNTSVMLLCSPFMLVSLCVALLARTLEHRVLLLNAFLSTIFCIVGLIVTWSASYPIALRSEFPDTRGHRYFIGVDQTASTRMAICKKVIGPVFVVVAHTTIESDESIDVSRLTTRLVRDDIVLVTSSDRFFHVVDCSKASVEFAFVEGVTVEERDAFVKRKYPESLR